MYDPRYDGALTSEALGDGDAVSTSYNADDQETATTVSRAGTALGTISYTLDHVGDVLTQIPSTGAPGAATTYTYNADQYLATSKTSATTTYAYDASGDPTATTGGSQAFDAAGRLCWSSATAVSMPSCSSAPTGATKYGYDADGDRTSATPTTGAAQTLRYDAAGHLTAMTTAGSTTATYTYDGRGLRESKTTSAGTTEYAWDARGGIPMLLTDAVHDYITGPMGAVIEQFSTAGSDWLFHDAHGSTVQLLNGAGAVAGSYTYTPDGATSAHTGQDSTPIQFAGALVDAESGFLYLQARYYDPATSEFLSVDPAVATTHQPYQYASGDPVNSVDPLGLETWWNPTTWDSKTWAWVGVGLGATALALTGVGLVFDLGAAASLAVGGTALGLSVVGEGIDGTGCVTTHDSVACAGALLNGVATLGAGADVIGAAFGIEALEGVGIAALPPALIGFGVDVYGAEKTTEEQEREEADARRRDRAVRCARLAA